MMKIKNTYISMDNVEIENFESTYEIPMYTCHMGLTSLLF